MATKSTTKKSTSKKIEVSAVSQNESAYGNLKAAITTLKYKPGEYLNTANIMQEMSLGRTPVNHALHRLSNEGLVQIIPRKGVVVSPLSIDDALQLIEVRLTNEVLCARLAAERISAQEIAELIAITKDFDAAVIKRDMPQVMQLDSVFHEKIAQAARNQILSEILKVLHARSQRFWAMSLADQSHLTEVQAEHKSIVDALSRGDSKQAMQTIETHILSFKKTLLNLK